MEAFELADLMEQSQLSGKAYLEFLRVPDLSVGIYRLPAGAADQQVPHSQDEVYYVVSGSAKITVAEDDRAVQAGSLIYVPKHVKHSFHTISEGLTLLVFFAPAEDVNDSAHD